MTTAKALLIAARKVIEDPAHWTKGSLARGANGADCPVTSSRAICFCAGGALIRSTHGMTHGTRYQTAAFSALEIAIGGSISALNDARFTTHADVLGAFDKAIEAAP